MTFMDAFEERFPSASIPVKMHMLEDHMLEWVRGHSVGCGLLGEQGAESIHTRFNSLHCTFASVPDGREKLRKIMRENLISITPQNVAARPPPKKRKLLNQHKE